MSSSIRTTLKSDALTRLAQAIAVTLCAGLAGCQSTASVSSGTGQDARPHALTAHVRPKPIFVNQAQAKKAPHDVWERIRDGFQLQDSIAMNPRVEQQRLWFVSNPSFLESASGRGSLYMHYIVERLEERDMPLELALLPVIESAFNPMAYSRSDASGLWQFIPSTGRYFNLRQTNFYDGRRDVTASTGAALDYLSKLHEMFNGDWLLALAAYNAGEGTVSRAMERNEKLGLPTDYWNLPLPQETRDYVPKLLALAELVQSPQAYGVNLNPIANQPYFDVVEVNQRVDLSRVAALAGIDEDEMFQLNPAFKKRVTMEPTQHLLVPTAKAQLLTASLSNMKPEELLTLAPAQRVFDEVAVVQPSRPKSYTVRRGDNLASIAKANKVDTRDLQRWNRLTGKNLKVGQTLVMQAETQAKGRVVAKAGAAASDAQKTTTYKVRKGDSLYLVAKRFNVEMQHLKRWNPRSGHALKPGQTLTVYLNRR
ncbi:lytic transglycosylase domain-containing protein [Pseudomonas coleopterorum]|uniref:Transglycosylase SLT domain-containing protein n=1 Tax=Pseudomonas coleopterorum TaxID=1605838 RepID=A0AAJ6M2B5_9PSED|nr:transglycosylase SLT domain-containing protein [Pseudomonas coleopterorum]WNC11357.1 transglycosylase SLT domain-containing protein [Pseudomonas coleopterorum]